MGVNPLGGLAGRFFLILVFLMVGLSLKCMFSLSYRCFRLGFFALLDMRLPPRLTHFLCLGGNIGPDYLNNRTGPFDFLHFGPATFR